MTTELLTAEQLSDLDNIRLDFAASEAADADFTTKRAMTFRRFFRYVDVVGKAQLESYVADTLKWDTKDVRDKDGYAICAMAVTGINVYAETDKERRKKLQNRIAPAAQALPAFFHSREQHELLNDDDYLTWYVGVGKLDKLYRNYRASQPKEAKAPAKSAADLIAAMLDNGRAIEVAGVPLKAGVTSLFVAQGEGAKARMVRLDVTPEFIASLADKTPDPLEGAPSRLLFFREMLMTVSTLLPNGKSDEPVNPVDRTKGEKVSDTTPMRPSNAVILVRDGKFSASLSRKEDGVVVEFESDDDKLRFLPTGFIDNVTRGTMSKRLSESNIAAGYIDSKNKLTVGVGEEGLVFKHREKRHDGQLLVKKLDRMNTSWVNRVSSFKHDVSVELDGARRKKLEDKFVAMVAKKRDGLPITLTFQGEKLSMAYGDAAALDLGGEASGEPRSVRVMLDDFRRVMAALLDLPLEDEIAISLDARGMVCISANTPATMIRAYIQTLQDGHGGAQVRERRLLEVVNAETDKPALLAA